VNIAQVRKLPAHVFRKPVENVCEASTASEVESRLALAVQHAHISTPLEQKTTGVPGRREEKRCLPVTVAGVHVRTADKKHAAKFGVAVECCEV
jgi:hypothetical protein